MQGTDSKKGHPNGRPWYDALESLRSVVKGHCFPQERGICFDDAGNPSDVEALGFPRLSVGGIMPAFVVSFTAICRTSGQQVRSRFASARAPSSGHSLAIWRFILFGVSWC